MSVVDAPPDAGCLRVLLVDDAADLRRLLRTLLDRAGGFSVVGEAGDGAEGVLLASRLQPDLVLLDLAMPVMDGLEAIPQIRKMAAAAKIVVLSGFASARLGDEVRGLGAHGYVEKSADPATIIEALLAAAGYVAPTGAAPPRPPASRVPLLGESEHAELSPEQFQVRQQLTALGALIDSTRDAVTSADLDGIIRSWNAGAERMFGWSAEEAVGRHVGLLVPPDRQSEAAGILHRVAGGDPIEHLETVRVRKDGSLVTISLTVSPILDATATVVGASTIARDVTEQRRMEQLAHASEVRLAAIVDLAVDAVITVDADQRITLFNEGAAAIFGWHPDEVRGQLLDVLLPEGFGDRHRRHVEDFAASPAPARAMGQRGQIHGRRRDGSTFPAEASICKLTQDGEQSFTVILRDVSERTTEMTERTTEMTELSRVRVELERRNNELERSNRELAELAYVASHDLGEPLRAISGFARLLADDCAAEIGPKGTEYVGFIIGGVARMQALINDVLEYSRAGTSGPAEPVDLAAVAREVLSLLDVADADGTVEVGHLPIVTWNVTPARQVLQNLLANALKFTRPGAAPQVRVSARREPGGWTLEVADNGIGVEATCRERAFRMFHRLNRRDEYPGTGIGLAICKKVIEQRGGDVAITDTPGGGTTVWFTVPDTEVSGT